MKARRLLEPYGQQVTEYAVLLVLVVAAIMAMQFYVKRGVQGRIKDLADQISGGHYEPGTTDSSTNITQSGLLNQSYLNGQTVVSQVTHENRSSNETIIPSTTGP